MEARDVNHVQAIVVLLEVELATRLELSSFAVECDSSNIATSFSWDGKMFSTLGNLAWAFKNQVRDRDFKSLFKIDRNQNYVASSLVLNILYVWMN